MKLKKKQFTKLQQIAFTANQILPGTGIQLDKLISDIESVQKPKEEFGFIDADQLKKDFRSGSPFFESLEEEARDMFFKEGKNAVENNKSVGNVIKGLRDYIEERREENKKGFEEYMKEKRESKNPFKPLVDYKPIIPASKQNETMPGEAPHIGDVGYFWDEPCLSAVYGKLDLIAGLSPRYQVTLNGEFVRAFTHFSKTPPELK